MDGVLHPKFSEQTVNFMLQASLGIPVLAAPECCLHHYYNFKERE